VLHCGCGHTDLWTFSGAEPRLLSQSLSFDGTCGPCRRFACGSGRRPHNVATPETPPPERAC
jgi:hypothetical protein